MSQQLKQKVIVIPREEIEKARKQKQKDKELDEMLYELEDLKRQASLLNTRQYQEDMKELRRYSDEIRQERRGTLVRSIVGTLASALLSPSQIHDKCELEKDCVVKGYVMYRRSNGRFVSSRRGVYVRDG